ncbi:hypothetical protein HPP92_011597 [Vanilla planifolia]|uniref:Uncharacterized protein n=1 Tax=Vanilla planifolia TaxID=51239 RepID=A0A835RBS7_VANPL|nr:hypothetical protein HPP92_011597 [Vanilla planifolia]
MKRFNDPNCSRENFPSPSDPLFPPMGVRHGGLDPCKSREAAPWISEVSDQKRGVR